jgi:hypothetical protein
MNRRVASCAAAIVAFVGSISVSQLAHAQRAGVDEFGGYGSRRGVQSESKQEAAFELRFGRYVPEVDSEVNGTPFQNTFGGDSRYMFGIEVDWQLLRIPHFGTLAPGIGWGYTKFAAKAKYADGSGVSSSSTSLAIMPMYLVGVLRADVIARELKVPLVPYAKLGVGYGLWWSSDGKRTAEYNGKKGRGASYGLTYALGAMFLLDVLSPDDAVTADGSLGINNSYLFAEWFRPQLDGFGSANVLDIGSSSWLLGIALEI